MEDYVLMAKDQKSFYHYKNSTKHEDQTFLEERDMTWSWCSDAKWLVDMGRGVVTTRNVPNRGFIAMVCKIE